MFGDRSGGRRLGVLRMAVGALMVLFACVLAGVALPGVAHGSAVQVATLSPGDDAVVLAPYMRWHYEEEARASSAVMFETLADGGFEPLPDGRATFGFRAGAFWFHAQLLNQDPEEVRRLLVQQYPLSDRIDLFVRYRDGRVIHHASGDTLPFSSRSIPYRHPNFQLELPPEEPVDLLMRVKSESSMQVPLVLYTPAAFTETARDSQLGMGLYYGILLALFFYNLILWLSLRDPSYFWYMFHVAGFGLVLFCLNGLAFEYLWPNSTWLQDKSVPMSICLSQIGMQQFARVFLGLRERWRPGDIGCTVMIGFFFLWGLASMLLPYRIATPVASAAVLPSVFWIAAVTFVTLRRGYRPAALFLLSWGVFLLGTATFTLVAFGVLPKMFITEYGVQIGSAMEMILLSFALAYRYAALRSENERIVHEAKEQLEHSVSMRTGELSSALEELAEVNGRLRESNRRDALTGTFNRRWFMAEFQRLLVDAREDQRPLGLLMIDIDHFKRINDTHGHMAGDECLRQVARHMQVHLQPHDALVARFGGEEFVVALRDLDQEESMRVAQALCRSIAAAPCECGDLRLLLTLSVGAYSVPAHEVVSPDEAIRRADAALYDAKGDGRNCVRGPSTLQA